MRRRRIWPERREMVMEATPGVRMLRGGQTLCETKGGALARDPREHRRSCIVYVIELK